MKNVGNKRYLESFKVFPYIAWFVIIVFSYFVYGITKELQTVTNQVEAQTVFLETTVNTPINSVKNFEN